MVPLTALRWWFATQSCRSSSFSKENLYTDLDWKLLQQYSSRAVSDVVKGYYIIKAQAEEGRTQAFMTLLIDRFVGLFGLIIISFFSLLANLSIFLENPRLHGLIWMIGILFIATICFYTLVIWPFHDGKDPFIHFFEKTPLQSLQLKFICFQKLPKSKPILLSTLLIAILIHCLVAFLF